MFPVFHLLNLQAQQPALNMVYVFHTEKKTVIHLIICEPVAEFCSSVSTISPNL